MRRPIIFVLLAGFAALVAALVVYSALKKRERQVQEAMVQSVPIVVASHDLTIGSKLDQNSTKMTRWSRDSVPPGAFTDPGSVMGQYTKTGFVENEPIVADRLFSGIKNAGVLPLLVPNGMRAMSVPVDEVADISGFVLPHTHVDILVTVGGGGPTGGAYSKIVLQNVEVLATAQDIEKINDQPQVVHTITVLVTPQDAERLALASGQGGLRLAMRNYDDSKVVNTSGSNIEQMLHGFGSPQMPTQVVQGQPRPVYQRPRPRAKPVQVEVLRNGKSSESVSFIRSGGGATSAEPAPEPPADANSSATDSDYKVAGITVEDEGAAAAAASTPAAGVSGALASSGNTSAPAPEAASSRKASAASGSHGLAIADSTASPFGGSKSRTIDIP
jgi:pilus assembly protein CpaB